MRIIIAALIATFVTGPLFAGDAHVASRVEKAMLGDHRSESNQDRNRYRNPVGTLTFLGLKDGMTVMEISPGGGWYTEILAPAIRGNGQFIVAAWDVDVEDQPEYVYRLHGEMMDKFKSQPDLYDQVAVVPFSPPQSANLGESESVDMILTFRNTHGWINNEMAVDIYSEFARVLKPGGILGVVQHRADESAGAAIEANGGYVSEAAIVAVAREAGLYLEARSDVNANPADTRDYEFGVWTLPPNLRACRDIEDEQEKASCEQPYLDIGESDRMTLRFRKPIK